jgi:hypothetical protein
MYYQASQTYEGQILHQHPPPLKLLKITLSQLPLLSLKVIYQAQLLKVI